MMVKRKKLYAEIYSVRSLYVVLGARAAQGESERYGYQKSEGQ